MNTRFVFAALLVSTPLLLPVAMAEPEAIGDGGVVIAQPPAGVTTSPICVWWNIPARYVTTPGASVSRPPVHVTVDPVTVRIPGSTGEICLNQIAIFDLERVRAIGAVGDGSSRDIAIALP